MAMIKGIPIVLLTRVQIGSDGFNMPIYSDELIEEVIENVLVSPVSSSEASEALDLYGKKIIYNLAIPKGDFHDWTDSIVRFFGQEWRTVGFPLEGIEENIPLDWNKKVMVERYG